MLNGGPEFSFSEGFRYKAGMYNVVLGAHDLLRWVVFVLIAWILVRAWMARPGGATWQPRDTAVMRVATVTLDIQLLLGLALLIFLSPITKAAFQDLGAAMGEKVLRVFAVEHPFGMLVALALAHVGSVKVKRATDPMQQAKRARLWWTLATVVIAVSIPWFRTFG